MLGHKNLLGNKYLKEFRYQKAQSITNTCAHIHTYKSVSENATLSSSAVCTNHPLMIQLPHNANQVSYHKLVSDFMEKNNLLNPFLSHIRRKEKNRLYTTVSSIITVY